VFEGGGAVRLRPSINLGPKEGFAGLEDRDLIADLTDIKQVGQMARRALDLTVDSRSSTCHAAPRSTAQGVIGAR
jgi:hypothetical protein